MLRELFPSCGGFCIEHGTGPGSVSDLTRRTAREREAVVSVAQASEAFLVRFNSLVGLVEGAPEVLVESWVGFTGHQHKAPVVREESRRCAWHVGWRRKGVVPCGVKGAPGAGGVVQSPAANDNDLLSAHLEEGVCAYVA